MRKLMTLLLAVLMLALPVLSLAETVTVEELGMTMDVPEGYSYEVSWDDDNGMLSIAIAPTEGGNVSYVVYGQYNESYAEADLSTLTDEQVEELAASLAGSIESPQIGSYTDETTGQAFVTVTSEAGDMMMIITIADSTLVIFGAQNAEGVTEDDVAVLDALASSLTFDEGVADDTTPEEEPAEEEEEAA